MIEVSVDMLKVVCLYKTKTSNMTDAELVKSIIELHEANKPKPEPLSDDEISKILFLCRKGKMFPYSFARDIEQAHGIGVTK